MAWYDERLSAFDVETTGVDPEDDRIAQSAIVSVGGGEPTRQTTLIVNPGVPIPDEAAAVHGITNERAEKEGVSAAGAIPTIARMITTIIERGRPLIIQNAPFDLTMLDRECRRYNVPIPPWEKALIVDPLVIDKWLDRFRRGSRRLEATCAHYGVVLGDDAHDATADALAAARLAWKMLHRSDAVQGRHPEIVQRRAFWKAIKDDLAALQDAQREWQAEQADSLRLHFEGKGETEKAASVRQGWPLVPFEAKVEA